MYNRAMKHALLTASSILAILVVIVAFNIAHAGTVGKAFGGKIINVKATEIQSLEESNYNCNVPGTSITIKPVTKGSPNTFLIPTSVKSRTNTTPRAGQQIKGLYSQSKTTIICKFRGTPPSSTSVTLTPITMYGTSK